MDRRIIAALALPALLSACGGAVPRPASAPPPVTNRPGPPVKVETVPPPRPELHTMRLPGVEGVIGATAGALLRQFGEPRLDVAEGDVRKLQFSGAPCVLDIYLYPPEGGGEPVAAYVDARRASDGQEVDRVQCVEALRQR